MATVIATYSLYFAQPGWLLAGIILVPVIWFAMRNLKSLGRIRRTLAIILRCLVVIILVLLLARLTRTKRNEQLTLIAVIDRSQSIPVEFQEEGIDYLERALKRKPGKDQLAVVDIAEAASISQLPSSITDIRRRNTTLTGEQTKLSAGIQMAMAIAPPDTASRIVLFSEGNETEGDVREAARIAASNRIPIDVLPVRYKYPSEVVFRRLAAPAKARSGQTVSLRFIMNSTADISGTMQLSLNNKIVDLVPGSAEIATAVDLKAGTNVKTVSIPVGTRGMHEFRVVFIPDDPNQDRSVQNNRATAMTYVAGPGHVLILDADGSTGQILQKALGNSDIEVRYAPASELGDNLAKLMDTDAVILVNTDCSNFTFQQQEMLNRYVTELGGGLIMIGGNNSFGAGGWIDSPIAEILPIDLDPPQKKQLPKGAVRTLSRLDMVGVLSYDWQGDDDWVYPLSEVGDKTAVVSAVKRMKMGDMPDLGSHMQKAYDALSGSDAVQKHVIVISDGDPAPPSQQLVNQYVQAGITCSTVGIFPHSPRDLQSLMYIAQSTGGRFYNVQDPTQLPQIFIKEAQVVRRALIVEETFTPELVYSFGEITRGLSVPLPGLDGYVLTGPKGGLNQIVFSSHQGDPVLATCQAGLGRCVAFTSSIDSRWASKWLGWGGFERFWEQAVRWVGKPAQSKDCEVFSDVQGRQVTVNLEALDPDGSFLQLTHVDGQVISPDISIRPLELAQVGPGRYRGVFQAGGSGSYIVSLRYGKPGESGKIHLLNTTVTIPFAPEFRDLTDNEALLNEVSTITGGRSITAADPNQANLFDYAGVKFPESQLPMTKMLMYVWLVLFLLDVAVRRVAVDFKAMVRRIAELMKRKSKRKVDKNLQRLMAKRKQVSEQLKARSDKTITARRYEASEEFKGELPIAKPEVEVKAPEKPAQEAGPSKPVLPKEESHIDKLLKAKRKISDKQQNKNEEYKPD
ncbi:MAG: VWA domain-containing protein [Planctomycetota bacterium]|jgi:uncharacterized membrane protein